MSKPIIFTLLLTCNRTCSKCTKLAEYILLDPENVFIGFFCGEHGQSQRDLLENKYSFLTEIRPALPVIKRRRKIIRRKRS